MSLENFRFVFTYNLLLWRSIVTFNRCNIVSSHKCLTYTNQTFCTMSFNRKLIKFFGGFNFVHQVEKHSLKHHKMRQNSVSFSCQYASFQTLHKFSAWTHLSNFDQSEHKNWTIAFPACKSRLNFRVLGHFEIEILKVRLMNTTYFMCILKKLNLSLRSFEK